MAHATNYPVTKFNADGTISVWDVMKRDWHTSTAQDLVADCKYPWPWAFLPKLPANERARIRRMAAETSTS